jgi:hypothetical protein
MIFLYSSELQNRNIDQASKEARKAHWIWKNKGNSNGSAESERKDMIKKKRTLRCFFAFLILFV